MKHALHVERPDRGHVLLRYLVAGAVVTSLSGAMTLAGETATKVPEFAQTSNPDPVAVPQVTPVPPEVHLVDSPPPPPSRVAKAEKKKVDVDRAASVRYRGPRADQANRSDALASAEAFRWMEMARALSSAAGRGIVDHDGGLRPGGRGGHFGAAARGGG